MNFVLIMQICSSIYLTCTNPIFINNFNNHYDCATHGYGVAKEILQDMGKEGVNKDKIIISFKCNENKINKTPASS